MENILNKLLSYDELEYFKIYFPNSKKISIKEQNEFYLKNWKFFKSVNKKFTKDKIINLSKILFKETNFTTLNQANKLFYCMDLDNSTFINNSLINIKNDKNLQNDTESLLNNQNTNFDELDDLLLN